MKTERKTKTVQVRLTATDFEWLNKAAYSMGTSASALVRQLVQMSINAVKMSDKALKEAKQKAEENKGKPIQLLESEVEVNEN